MRADSRDERERREPPSRGRLTRFRSLAALQDANRACRACADAGHDVALPPVFEGTAGQRAYLLGQAPGLLEWEQGRPWRGRAGDTLRRWLGVDDETFVRTFYCASVTRCYPGKAASGRGDRSPTAEERRLCSPWWREELRLLDPPLIVPVGGLAVRELLGLTRLGETIGKSYLLGHAVVVPLPHPSGASGWLNRPEHRARLGKALTHVRRELERAEREA